MFLKSNNLDLEIEAEDNFGNIFGSIADVMTAVIEDRAEKYRGSFSILGPFGDVVEDFGGYFEIACTFYNLFNLFKLIGAVVSS